MSEASITKQCVTCKKSKPISEFHNDRQGKHGRRPNCKSCVQAYGRFYNKTDAGKARGLKYRNTEKGKITISKYLQGAARKITTRAASSKYYYSHPQESKAKAIIDYAIRIGKMPHIGNLLCSCGNQAQQYHHHRGYAKKHWLHVIPVCISCHTALHKTTSESPHQLR